MSLPKVPKPLETEDIMPDEHERPEVDVTVSAGEEPTPQILLDKKEKKSPYPKAFEGLKPPKQLWHSRRIGDQVTQQRNGKKVKGVLHVCGRGSKTAKVMFISPSVYREEEMTLYSSEPAMLNGPAGNLFLRFLYQCGFKDDEWYYTALCKYNVPRLKPSSQDIRWNADMLMDEIQTIKPKLIVCLGKLPFDHLYKTKFKLNEVQGGFFRSDELDCILYPMDTLLTPLMKPEYQERMLIDLKAVRRCLDEIDGHPVVKMATDYQVLDTVEKIGNFCTWLTDEINAGRISKAAVDCEWKGQTAWSGQLRSLQMCWTPGKAAYFRFGAPSKGKFQYTLEKPLPEVREIIKTALNNPKLHFIGHSAHADMAWMQEHLDINVWHRFCFDTLFAQQLVNEYSDLKLERLAVQHTDLGRYDIELLLWKKKNKFDEDDNEGYGLVPDDILIPYGLRDVDATMRCFPILMRRIIKEGLSDYFFNYTVPFVTDGFHELMTTGIPTDREYLEQMRDVYKHHGDILLSEFKRSLQQEANKFLLQAMMRISSNRKEDTLIAATLFSRICGILKTGRAAGVDPDKEIRLELQRFCDDGLTFAQLLPVYLHWLECPDFNLSSTDHVRRWLFDVKGFKPIKTTKRDGVQMAWDKVLTLPPDRRSQYTPAADKQTIKVFAAKDRMVAQVEELKSVQNISKAFLKGPDEEGREQGLNKWIQPDDRIHANFALTETHRPRTWKPNILNWPKAITKPIEKAFERINILVVKDECKASSLLVEDKQIFDLGVIGNVDAKPQDREEAAKRLLGVGFTQAQIEAYVRLLTKPTSIRGSARAPKGYAFIDMDLKTAEIVALANLSGDPNMIRVLTEPDTQYARIDKDNPKKAVRICYNDNVKIPEAKRDASVLTDINDPRILRDESGAIMHPLRDIHWEMAEETAEGPREKLEERLYRDGCGKVGNFSIPYGAAATLLERMIEANTGIKPPEGMGQKMIDTYTTRYQVAAEYQRGLETTIEDPGFFRAITGCVRHFYYNNLGDLDGLSDYTREGILSPLKRQARNFPMQHLVAASTNRALARFIRERDQMKLQSRIMMLLYDAMTALAPLDQLKKTSELLRNCMTVWCPWKVHGRTFNFDVDVNYGFRWGVKPTGEEKKLLKQYV